MLAAFDEPPSGEFRQELESLDALFRQQWSASDGSVPAGADRTTDNLAPDPTIEQTATGKVGEPLTQVSESEPPEPVQETGSDPPQEAASTAVTFESAIMGAGADVTPVSQPAERSAPPKTIAETRPFLNEMPDRAPRREKGVDTAAGARGRL